MADGLNRVQLIGNLAADPEMKYTANGSAVTNFRMGVSRTFDGKQQTEWVNVVTWQKLAELCGQYLSKGRQTYVEGRLQTRNYEAKDGTKRYITEIVATNVLFLGSGNGGTPRSFDPDIDPDDLPFED